MLIYKLLSENPDLEKILKNMPETVKNRCVIKKYPSNSIIQRKDDTLTSFSIICMGEVRIINEFDNGNLYTIEKNKAIDFIGEVTALAGEEKTSVTIEAITDCITIQLSLFDFFTWIKSDNDFLLMLSRRVASKLYNSSYTKGVELFYPAIHLMLNFLINYINKDIKGKNTILIDMTRQQISEKLGVTVRTVNRTIKQLKDENLISINKGKIQVDSYQYIELVKALENRKYL